MFFLRSKQCVIIFRNVLVFIINQHLLSYKFVFTKLSTKERIGTDYGKIKNQTAAILGNINTQMNAMIDIAYTTSCINIFTLFSFIHFCDF